MIKNKSSRTRTGLEVAVIGLAGRFPGARNISEFWNNLKNGVESISFFSDEELKGVGVDEKRLKNPNFVKGFAFLQDTEYFDSGFFGYTPKEAQMMDPQMRIAYEVTWEALEDAGYNPDSYPGLIGLYAGASSNLYWEFLTLTSGFDSMSERFAANQLSDKDFISTRVSYKLNLKGPSSSVHTACSTSLVVIHQACRALLSGECKMAVAGGVSISTRKFGYIYQQGMISSPDGHCRAFDISAKGTVFGEGVGFAVLKRLKNAIEDGDNIYAVIRGSAINNDGGRKVGYTAPSIEGQAEVIRIAQRMARIEPENVSYIETHGTGTELGDPVEIEGLKLAFNTDRTGFCRIGSVKTNVGHMNVSAGIAGFIKAVFCLKYKLIPPSLHFGKPNPKIGIENSPFVVNTELVEWKNNGLPNLAGVSSFGIGGTNAHVVLEEWDEASPEVQIANSRTVEAQHLASQSSEEQRRRGEPCVPPPMLILLSARTKQALDRAAGNLKTYLEKDKAAHLPNVAYTLQVGRRAFKHRRMFVSGDLENTIALLDSACEKEQQKTTAVHDALAGEEKKPVFMFSGQGAQYGDMGRELYETEPLFREVMDHCLNILEPLVDVDLKEIIYPRVPPSAQTGPAADINRTEITQPVLFAFEYALAKLLMSWGIKPYAMIGHSIGEYTAACLAGVFSLEDALKIVALRGKLMQQMPAGSMLSVRLPEEKLTGLNDSEVELAAVNAPELCVVSGSHESIDHYAQGLQEQGHKCRTLHTSHAFHSRMMEPILEKFSEAVSGITLNKPEIPYISNVSGNWITLEEAISPGYWAKHLRVTVRFCDGVSELLKDDKAIFIEVGPGRALTTFVRQHGERKPEHQAFNLIRHPQEEVSDNRYLLERIGRLWINGLPVDWQGFYTGRKPKRVSLPTYPFDRHRYWIEETTPEVEKGKTAAGRKIQFRMEMDSQTEQDSTYAGPESETEKIVARIWHEVLGIPKVGVYDDFFELGGDSLKAITISSRIYKETKNGITLTEFFNGPTIKEIAGYIDSQSEKSRFYSIEPVEEKEYYPLSSAQRRLFILQQLEPANTGYNLPIVFRLEGKIKKEALKEAVEKLILRHESFRTGFFMQHTEPVQKIYNMSGIEFDIEYYEAGIRDQEVGSSEKQVPNPVVGARRAVPADQERRGEPGVPPDMRPGSDGGAGDAVAVDQPVRQFIRPFDLSKPPLFRMGMIETGAASCILMVDIHHIIHDGTSQVLFLREFSAVAAGKELSLLKIRYKDFSHWQSRLAAGGFVKKQEEYWLQVFSGDIPVLNLPTDFARPAVQSFAGDALDFEIGAETTARVKKFTHDKGVTLYMVLLSIMNVLLSKLSSREDIVIGTPIIGRRHTEIDNVIGLFVNTLVLRNYPAGGKSFKEFLTEVRNRTLNAFENQEYQFEDLVEKVAVNRDTGRNPLFDVMFALQNIAGGSQRGPGREKKKSGFAVKPYHYESKTAKFDMEITARESADILTFKIEYCTKLFKRATIERFVKYFKKVCTLLINDPELPISRVEIILDEEKEQILRDFNDTEHDYPREKTITQMFAEQVERTPEGIAVTGRESDEPDGEKDDRFSLTYRELDVASAELAAILVEKGVKTGTIAALMVERSFEMIIGLFAILRAGGAYLPIEPGYPAARKRYLLRDSRAKLLLITPGLKTDVEKLEHIDTETFVIEKIGIRPVGDAYMRPNSVVGARRAVPEPTPPFGHPRSSPREGISRRGEPGVPPDKRPNPVVGARRAVPSDEEPGREPCIPTAGDPAYVIYTSGSTGNPKGVIIEHRSVINRLNWMQRFYPLDQQDMILQKTTFVFDVSVWELFWWSFCGASLCLLEPGGEKNPAAIVAAIEANRVTTMHFVPSMLTVFLEYCEGVSDLTVLSSLRQVFASGEALTPHHAETFNRLMQTTNGTNLINLYGPTEATVDVSYYNCKPGEAVDSIPIGKPIDNTQLFIINSELHLQPIGAAGELCIAGDNLARGYLNRPELTNNKFIFIASGPAARGAAEGPSGHLGAAHHLNNQPKQKFCSNFFKSLAPGRVAEGKKFYKTGDLARWRYDGNIEFLGRIDHQVKVRGFRIELGEIEDRLLRHPGIKEVVVVAAADKKGESSLCAYMVCLEAPDNSALREYLSKTLPDYMIPTYFIRIDNMPLTASGKIDRKSLPEPGVSRPDLQVTYVAPNNDIEKKIADIWKEVLKLDEIGVNDNFFDLGGHSLDVIRVSNKLKEEFKREIPVVSMFRYRTIGSFADFLTRGGEGTFESKDRSEMLQKGEEMKNRRLQMRRGNRK